MFFKKKLSVDTYLKTRFDLLFSEEQKRLWLQQKDSWLDKAKISVNDNLFLAHLGAAHIEVISMALTKKYAGNLNMFIEMEDYIKDYLIKHKQSYINDLLPLYSKAIGSIPQDGILGITTLLADCICFGNQTEEIKFALGAQLYHAVDSIRADFKMVKLIPNEFN